MKKLQQKLLLAFMILSIVISGIMVPAKDTQAATKKVYLGKYTLTAYCPCKKCSGSNGKKTAKQGRTIAVDKKKIKLGTKIRINGKTYTAEDTGGAIKGKRIDVYFNSHKKALKFGKKTKVKVYKIVKK